MEVIDGKYFERLADIPNRILNSRPQGKRDVKSSMRGYQECLCKQCYFSLAFRGLLV
jgi:hypothetical protein